MPSLDGIRGPRYGSIAATPRVAIPAAQPALPPIPTPIPTQRQTPTIRLPVIRVPSAVWAVLVVGIAGAALVRPAAQLFTAEASTIPPRPTTRSTDFPLGFVQTQHTSTNTDNVVVIDQPTVTSIAQPDNATAVSTANETAHVLPTVRVLNGSTTVGKANDAKTQLEQQHYHVLSIGSAQFSYVQTTIYYLPGNKASAKVVAAILGHNDATLTEDSIASPADVLVVIGNDTP